MGGVYPRLILNSPPVIARLAKSAEATSVGTRGLPRFVHNDTLIPVFARPDRAEAISVAGTMGAGTSPLGVKVPWSN